MVRTLALAMLVCLASLGGAQKKPPTLQQQRTKALDAAALTPFFTKRGADNVKRVIDGADTRKVTENDALRETKADPIATPTPKPDAKPVEQPPQPQAAPQQPQSQPEHKLRLLGISFGNRGGMALFQLDGQNVTVRAGAHIGDAKVLTVDRHSVVIALNKQRIELTPW